jgi:hypothetical protein
MPRFRKYRVWYHNRRKLADIGRYPEGPGTIFMHSEQGPCPDQIDGVIFLNPCPLRKILSSCLPKEGRFTADVLSSLPWREHLVLPGQSGCHIFV